MELSSLIQSPSTTVEIIHPLTNKPTGISFVLASRHRPEVKSLARSIADKRMASVRQNKPLDTAAMDEESLDLLVASIKGWSGIEDDGAPVPFSQQKAREILSREGLEWVRKQLDEAMGNDALFFQP